MLVLAAGATASAQVVTNSADSGPGTLRSAITNAASGAVITFDPSLSGATITLSNTLTINTNLTIDASALPGGLQINGNGSVQIFNVASNITVFLNSLTITNGYTVGGIGYGGGGIYNDGTLTLTNCTLSGNSADFGGGILNGGTLTLIQCTVSGNSTGLGYGGSDSGGGIYNNYGTLTLSNCTLSGNSANFGGGIDNEDTLMMNQCTLSENYAEFDGGGIYVDSGASLTVNGSTFSGNQTDGIGGGLFVYESTLTINNSTFSGNQADNFYGGGIFFSSTNTLTINGSTFSANFAGEGGGIYFEGGTLMINNSTFSANSAREVGGIERIGGTMAIANTIVAGNSGGLGADIYNYSGVTFGGSNLVQSVYNYAGYTGPAPLTNAPDLAPLGNYGGPTQTMPPLPGSPAIGAGSVAANTFSTDQRGYPRTQNGLIDLGAVEVQSPAANPPVLENLTVPADGGNGLQFTFTSAPAADFTVLTATNVALALTNWTVLGEVQQVAPGQYEFTDPQAATNPVRFYRVRSP
jgi:predicted outer membrane repeat protein